MSEEITKVEWPREAVLELAQMWERHECLYNPKHNFYHNKHARYQALSELAEGLQGFMPGIGPNDVKLKINYLRGQYTREVGKCNSKKSGSGTDEIYVPNAFWFKNLSFLSDFVKVRKGESNFASSLDDSTISQSYDSNLSPPGPSKKRARPPNESLECGKENDILEAAAEALKSITNKPNSESNGSDEAFCKFLMKEINTLKNEEIEEELKENFVHLLFQAKREDRKLVQSSFEVNLYD